MSLEEQIVLLTAAINKLTAAINDMQVQTAPPQTRYIPVSKWNEKHDYPSLSAMRSFIFNKDKNGFSACMKKVGKKIFIDEVKFEEWIASNPKTQ